MLRMIIADDEPFVRETISRIIDWENYGIELIGSCRDGIETYNMILDEYPDLVLLDINMPGINGLDLIQQIRAIDDTVSFIIISGYDNFEYAKRAMQYGVQQYLLKPCNRRQIIEAIQSVKNSRQKQELLISLKTENLYLKRRFHDTMQNQFLLEVFSGSQDTASIIHSYEKLLAPDGGAFSLLYITYLEERYSRDLASRIWKFTQSMTSPLYFHMLYVSNTAVLVFRVTDIGELLLLKEQIVSLSFDGQATSLECIMKHYPDFSSAMFHMVSNLSRYNRILQFSEDQPEREIYNLALSLQQIQIFLTDDLTGCPESTEEDRGQLLSQLFSGIHDLELAKILATRFLFQICSKRSPRHDPDFPAMVDRIYNALDVSSLKDLLYSQMESIGRQDEQAGQYKDFINQIIQYVHSHLSDSNLSLKWIADNVLFMNVTYLSKQFSRATGEKFSSYLNHLRMERARELLTNCPDMKMTDIAAEIGLGDNPQYFSQLFKKYEGMTPSQFSSGAGVGEGEDGPCIC